MDASSSIAAQQASSSSSSTAGAAAVFSSTSRLDTLPNELLQHIWIHLDDPTSFALTNKRLRAISQDTLWRAKWFMQRYATFEVFFCAISRVNIFNKRLVKQLLRLGAPVSRNLFQLLHLVREYESFKEESCCCNPFADVNWGHISGPSFATIERQAKRLYGEEITEKLEEYDTVVYQDWMMEQQGLFDVEEEPQPTEQVRRLFKDFNFMPLPIDLIPSQDNCIGMKFCTSDAFDLDLSDAVSFDPSLFDTVFTNGYVTSTERSEAILSALFERSDFLKARGEFWPKMEKLLDEDGTLRISREYVHRTIFGRDYAFGDSFGYIGSLFIQDTRDSWDDDDDDELNGRYDCLRELDRKSALPFKLQDAIEDALSPLAQSGSCTNTMISLLDKLDKDFSNWSRITPLFVLVTFLKAERQSVEDVDEVKRMMGSHEVTSASIMLACLRNGCRSVMPIRHALKYVDDFRANLQAFIEELLDALLYQPYRGIMLRELDRFFAQEEAGSIDFLKLLAAAVEDQAFLPEQLVPLESNVATTDATIRRTLGFSFKHQNARASELCTCSFEAQQRYPEIYHGKEPPRQLSYCQQPGKHFPRATRTPWLSGFLHFGGRSVPATAAESASPSSLCNNLLGCIYEDDEHVAEVDVDLLGPRSRAADVLLSHALLNGNQPLVAHLLEHGVALTLEHFRVADEVSNLFPKALVQSIKRGLPLRSSYEGLQQVFKNETRSISTSSSVDVAAPALDLDFNSSTRLLAHVEQWIKQLISLMSAEEEQTLAVEKPLPVSFEIQWASSDTRGVSLRDAIRVLQQHASRLRSEVTRAAAQQPEAESSLDSLPEETRDGGAADSIESDIHERVTGMLRGFKRTRSDRRAAFKQSTYSYKAIGFRGRFVTREGYGGETKTHEPQFAPLSDEDSADEDFDPSLELSDDESSSSTSTSSDSELEDNDEGFEPPLKRAKGNDGHANISRS